MNHNEAVLTSHNGNEETCVGRHREYFFDKNLRAASLKSTLEKEPVGWGEVDGLCLHDRAFLLMVDVHVHKLPLDVLVVFDPTRKIFSDPINYEFSFLLRLLLTVEIQYQLVSLVNDRHQLGQ